MLKLGILTAKEFLRLEQEQRRHSGAHVAYNLLNVGEHPTPEQIQIFEDISFTLRTSNGTFRTTFRNRFAQVDQAALRWIQRIFPEESHLRIQDRAVSHGLTAKEFAEVVFAAYPEADYEASDLLLNLAELSLDSGEIYIAEEGGVALQYLKAPFAVSVHHPEPLRYPMNRWISSRARRRFDALHLPKGWTTTTGGAGYKVRTIPYIHPEALALSRSKPNFHFIARSVFDRTEGSCHVLRTMNIFNSAYFSAAQLSEGVAAAWNSVSPGGLWIVGRTLEEDLTNHVSFLRRTPTDWEVLERIGDGSEMERFAVGR
jgi:hypothetical protein